ncbi:MAG: hypothetical protein HZB50_12405 [Chloroflexi bacterium]|nr:hypothetical protein [Chloroflexota bacterium]
MYQVYPYDNGVDVLVCFPFAQLELSFPFRDKLTKSILQIGNMEVHRTEGYPLPLDSTFRFYSKKHAIPVEKFLRMNPPGLFSRLINSPEWVSFQDEERLVSKMIDIEIETSHDFPGIVVNSRIHSEITISDVIQETAKGLEINLPRNKRLGFIKDVVTSNGSFGL